jgi:hypothetical protein
LADLSKFSKGIKMKKKGEFGEILLWCIVALIVLGVIMLIFTKQVLVILSSLNKDFPCAFTTSFQSMTKSASIIGITPIKLHCPREDITIVLTESDAKNLKKKNKNEGYYSIDKRLPKKEFEKIRLRYNEHSRLLPSEHTNKNVLINTDTFEGEEGKKALYEYRMNELIANEMKSCWNKLGRGELDLFSDFELKENPFEKKPKNIGAIAVGAGTAAVIGTGPVGIALVGVGATLLANTDLHPTLSRCVVCDRIIFQEKVNKEFDKPKIESLPLWTQVHPTKFQREEDESPISYYEFLLDDSTPKGFFESSNDARYYYSTDKAYAIVFQRINFNGPLGILKKSFNKVKEITDKEKQPTGNGEAGFSMIYLLPYEKLYEQCKEIEN